MESFSAANIETAGKNHMASPKSRDSPRRPLGELRTVEVAHRDSPNVALASGKGARFPLAKDAVHTTTNTVAGSSTAATATARGKHRRRSSRRNLSIPDPSTSRWDLTSLVPLTSHTVLQTLHSRYASGCYYTFAGVALVAMNPFQQIKSLYSMEGMEAYCGLGKECRDVLPPHLFSIAEESLSSMQRGLATNQSVIISGESGAGKTFSARSLMEYFVLMSSMPTDASQYEKVNSVARKIVQSNPLLEAFGNASTSRNANSSRFGKYIKLQYNRNGEIVSAEVQTYLLEKTRVSFQALGEANYHVFYQLVSGASPEERQDWHLPQGQQYRLLPSVRRHPASGIKADEDAWKETCHALSSIGISHDQLQDIGKLLSALLHLGNLDFSEDDLLSSDSLQHSAELLGLAAEVLLHTLTHRQITAGTPATRLSTRCESFSKPCELAQCCSRRDTVAKLAYSRLFDWLISFVNDSLCSSDAADIQSFIGLLDVYGFENFARNSLEQLCINYANEKLHNVFVHRFIKSQQTEYGAEGLNWDAISYRDNSPCLAVIDARPGIFALLDEECQLNRSSDAEAVAHRLLTGVPVGKLPVMCRPPSKLASVPSFQISHFAGVVLYSTAELVEKNKDHVAEDLLELLTHSSSNFISKLAAQTAPAPPTIDSPCSSAPATPRRQGPKRRTVVSKFKASVDSLVHVLSRTTSHYIRCIKPNTSCAPCLFDKDMVMAQLTASSVMETIKISHAGFPVRMPYDEFLSRYKCLLRHTPHKEHPAILKVLTPKGTPLLWPETKRSCGPASPGEAYFTPATNSLTLRTSLSSRFFSDDARTGVAESVVRSLDFNAPGDSAEGRTSSSSSNGVGNDGVSTDGVHLHVSHASPVDQSTQSPGNGRRLRQRGTKRRLESQEAYPTEEKTVYMGGEKVQTAAILASALLGDGDLRTSVCQQGDKENSVALAEKIAKNKDLQEVACMGNTKVFLKEAQLLQLEQLRDTVQRVSATRLQVWWRCTLRRKHRAATAIQATWHAWQSRQRFLKLKSAVSAIQLKWRSCGAYRQRFITSETRRQQKPALVCAAATTPPPTEDVADCFPAIPVPPTPLPQRLAALLVTLNQHSELMADCRRTDAKRRLVTIRHLPKMAQFYCYVQPLLNSATPPLHLQEPKGLNIFGRSLNRLVNAT